MPASRYKVRVEKDSLVFCSGHFITYDGDHCERIHGHNYRAAIEVEAELDQNHYVFDFIALKELGEKIALALDHRMLLPTQSPLIRLEDDGENWMARYKGRRWSFPKEECVLLPIANTTAELLASYFAERLREELEARGLVIPPLIRIEIEESFGQLAVMEWRRDDVS
ncbi:6-carboxytetrahydropterin synthase [Isosphaeraceae bacterium EP7]